MKQHKSFEEQIKQSLSQLEERPPDHIWDQLEQGDAIIQHSIKFKMMKQLAIILVALSIGIGGTFWYLNNQNIETPSEQEQEPIAQAQAVDGQAQHADEVIRPLLERAHRAGKTLAIYVYMDNCIFCAKLEDEVLAKPEVKELMSATAYQADLHILDKKVKNLVQHFDINAAPAFLFFNDKGEMVYKILGFREQDVFLELWEEGIEIANSEFAELPENTPIKIPTENELQIYPNPNNGQFTVATLASAETAYLRISDMNGRVLVEKKVTPQAGLLQLELDISSEARGNYVVQFQQGKQLLTKQVVLQ